MPVSVMNTQYFRKLFSNSRTHIQIIIQRKRIQFIKNGVEKQGKCNFDCFYYCYKINLPKYIIWLE